MNPAGALIRAKPMVVSAWVIVAALLVPRAAGLPHLLDTSARIDGSEAARVERLLAGSLGSRDTRTAVLVIEGLQPLEHPEGEAALRRIARSLAASADVQSIRSYLDGADTVFRGTTGTATFALVGLVPAGARPDEQIARLRERTTALAREMRPENPSLALRWTGDPVLTVDVRAVSGRDVRAAERRALPLTAAFLLLASGSVVAALVPVALGAVAIAVTLGAAAFLAHWIPLTLLFQSVVSMLGLAVGIDYALLMVSRFREGLAAGLAPAAAAERASRTAGRTIVLSAATVAVGFLALLLVPVDQLRSIGAGGMLVVTVSALLAVTLLPVLLAWLGHRVDWGRVWRRDHRTVSERRWRRLGHWVTGHPWTALAAGGTPLLWLAGHSLALRPGLPEGDWLPPTMESTVAVNTLERMGRAGLILRLRVVLQLPETTSVRRRAGWRALAGLHDSLAADPRVAEVRSVASLARAVGLGRTALAFLPAEATQGIVSEDGRLAVLDVIPRDTVSPSGAVDLVGDLRAGHGIGDLAGGRVLIGGLPASSRDFEAAISGRIAMVVPLAIGATLIALFAGFRSILVAVKATGLNLLSVGAAFGAVVIVFQRGYGGRWLGVAEPLGEVFPSVPIIVFCVVFGLSMDYEIFLIGRIAEARWSEQGDREAIVAGLAATGPIISSAATVMLVVFVTFTLGDFLMIKLIGFALAVAVLVDATVVRMVVGPALLQLAGRYNWWPGRGSHAVSGSSRNAYRAAS